MASKEEHEKNSTPKYKLKWRACRFLEEVDFSAEANTPEEVGDLIRKITWGEPHVTELRIAINRPVRLMGHGGHALFLPGEEPDPLEQP